MRSKYLFSIGERIIGEHRDISILDRTYKKDHDGKYKKMYKYKCNICGWDDGWTNEYNLKKCEYCACCHGNIVVEGINDIPTTAPWMIDYFRGGYEEAKHFTRNSGITIIPICPYCKKIHNKHVRIITLFKQHGFGCECSSDKISYPEKFIIKFLQSQNINFIFQLTKANIEWANKYKYDFYLNDYNMIIEVNGGQHYRNSIFNTTLEFQKQNDSIKRDLAMKNGITHYISLDCSNSNANYIINSIMETDLLDILNIDISHVNWMECDKFAQSNLVKSICDYYMNHKGIETKKIADYFHLHTSTICRYLNQGKLFGWCNYNSNKQRIEVFDKSGLSLGVFDSANDIVNKTDYGRNATSIRNACMGKIKRGTYNGYIFKYV